MEGIAYLAPPTCGRFMRSEAFGRLIAGPVGSGKTTACVIECLRRAIQQAPAADGYSYTRFSVIRQTLKQLKDTVLKDCQDWLRRVGDWKVSDSTFIIEFDRVRSELVFIPLENAEDQARLLSMQLTGAWLSECIEMDFSVLAPIAERCGRYPNGAQGVPTWHGMLADTNMPAELTPWHRLMTEPPPDWDIFVQPSGLEPVILDANGNQISGAENLNHLVQTKDTIKLPLNHPIRLAQGRKYYERLVGLHGAESDRVKRYVKAQYGNDPSGQAVFKDTFNMQFHVVNETLLIPGYPLIVGQDFGRNPWSLICQMDHTGRLLVHQEVPGINCGIEKHVTDNLKPLLFSNKYIGYKVAVVGDPAGQAKGVTSEESCFGVLKRLGLSAFPAVTNDLDPRIRAVEAMLIRQTGGKPTLAINRAGCPHLIRALGGGYRFTKTHQGQLRAVPEKDEFSHVADALECVCLVINGGLVPEYARILNTKKKPRGPRVSAKGWT